MKSATLALFLSITLSNELAANFDKDSQNILVDTYLKESAPEDKTSDEALYQTYTAQSYNALKNMKKCTLLDLETLNQVKLNDSPSLKEALEKRLNLIDAALTCYEPQTELQCEQSLAWSIIIESLLIAGIIGLGAIIYTTPIHSPID